MVTINDNVKTIRDLAAQAGLDDKDLVDACRQIVSEADKPTAQGMVDALKEHVKASEDPRERLKRKLSGQPE